MKHRTPGQNARLHSMAPEMLEALKVCVSQFGRVSIDSRRKLLPEQAQRPEIAEAMRVIRMAEGWPLTNITIDHEATP